MLASEKGQTQNRRKT